MIEQPICVETKDIPASYILSAVYGLKLIILNRTNRNCHESCEPTNKELSFFTAFVRLSFWVAIQRPTSYVSESKEHIRFVQRHRGLADKDEEAGG